MIYPEFVFGNQGIVLLKYSFGLMDYFRTYDNPRHITLWTNIYYDLCKSS